MAPRTPSHLRATRSWCLYDVGHSAFATTMMAAVLPIYFSQVVGADLDPDPERARVLATSSWGYANTLAMALTAVSAPLLGALADAGAGRKRLLGMFALAGALAASLLVLVGRGDAMLAIVLYVLGRIAFSSSIVMYDSLLPHVAAPGEMDAVSTRGFAWGYLGGGLLLAVQLVVITWPERLGIPSVEWATRLAFLSVGVWWLLFTVPLLRDVRDPGAPAHRPPLGALAVDSFRRLRTTFRELREHREAFRFLLAFWLYNDGIGTIVVMATIFGAEIGIDRTSLIGALLAVQLLGFPFSLLFGRLAGRVGAQRAILVGIAGYGILCVMGWFLQTALHFWLLAIGVSMVQGGTQALSRSLFAGMIPPARSSEFFGFYDVSSKFAGIVGPLVFATVGQLAGSSRYGVLALVVLFAAGAAMLVGVRPERSRGVLGQSP